jgi:hypothetical protein
MIRFPSSSLILLAALPALGADSPRPISTEFSKIVEPFIANYCADCHDDSSPKGDLDLTALTPSMATAVAASSWQKMLEQVQAGVMPPVGKDQPTNAERTTLIRWIQETLLASEHGGAYRAKLLLPQFGNYVDHEQLFSGEIKTPAFSPSRIWRSSPFIFEARGRVNKAVKGVQNPYSFSTPKTGVRDYAISSEVGASTVETLLLNANAELDWQFAAARQAIEEAVGKEVHRAWVPFVPFLTGATNIPREEPRHSGHALSRPRIPIPRPARHRPRGRSPKWH